MKRIKVMDEKEYLFGVILYNIAPTLAGHKPSSMITLNTDNRNLYLLWERYKKSFLSLWNIGFYEVKRGYGVITLLFYDRKKLEEVIYEDKNMAFLYRFGYRPNFSLEENLEILKLRLEEEFPHEVGILLGIPLEEVVCFIKKPDQECLLSGYWKVYKNPSYAREQFLNYDNDKNSIIRLVLEGAQPSWVVKK